MNTPVTIGLLCFFVAWLVSFGVSRDSKWAFPLWFPFTATSAIGTLAWLAVIPTMCSGRGGGEAAAWAAFGAWRMFLYLVACPIVLAVSIIPNRPTFSTAPVVATFTIISYVIVIFGVVASARFVERIPVHITLTDSDGVPVSDAAISYETIPQGSGFHGTVLKDEGHTDATGAATIFTQKTHQLIGTIRKPDFEVLHFHINRDWGFGRHQSGVSWGTHPADKKLPQYHSAGFDLPVGTEFTMQLCFPRTGQETLPDRLYMSGQ